MNRARPSGRIRAGERPERLAPARHGCDPAVFVPQGYEAAYDYPLLVWLPGSRPGFDLGRAMGRLSLRNFVAVQPAGPEGDGEQAVWRAIDAVRDRLSVHPRRTFLIGRGDGGCEAFRIACRHVESFAGVVSLGGPFPICEPLFARLHEVRRLPMLLCRSVDADADEVRDTDRTLRLFHAAGAMLSMRIYPRSGSLSRAALGDVNRWVMGEVCGEPSTMPSRCVS